MKVEDKDAVFIVPPLVAPVGQGDGRDTNYGGR